MKMYHSARLNGVGEIIWDVIELQVLCWHLWLSRLDFCKRTYML